MKLPITEAAARLRLHPCELVIALAAMVGSFEELYPEVDEGFAETWRQMHPEHFAKPPRDADRKSRSVSGHGFSPLPRLSKDSERLALVLSHKKHWGNNTVSEATLRNHYCRGISDFDSAVRELTNAGILTAAGPRGPFSLNTKAKAQIEELRRRLETGTHE